MKKDADSSFKDAVKSGLAGIASVFKKGPAEKAGAKIDDAIRKTKDAFRDASDKAKK
jgi:S1-C subfamily serine protease